MPFRNLVVGCCADTMTNQSVGLGLVLFRFSFQYPIFNALGLNSGSVPVVRQGSVWIPPRVCSLGWMMEGEAHFAGPVSTT